MAILIYSAITSLDGYVSDTDGNFDWTAPDEEVHAYVNDSVRSVGTFLFGRRMYEVMSVWDALYQDAEQPAVMRDFAQIWHEADKVVFSRTLDEAATARTRIERDFDPEMVRRLKRTASRDIAVGGPDLAAETIRAGLVDEYQQFLSPIVIGGGTSFLPDGVRVRLELIDEHRFTNGVVHLRYRSL
ncbi:dihydrofolate reductase family protein [Glaciibacter superstes]|uniref:dihydrofolate reductase family protein n=1 Tax=Glaciibacter superstes TaxID=501023 RepID=UPI0003B67BC7|nr:dihydrofolate reductase family protein [Glaciibacter superstes]